MKSLIKYTVGHKKKRDLSKVINDNSESFKKNLHIQNV